MQKKVLILDDSRIIRLSIKILLDKYNLTVLELGKIEHLFSAAWRYKDVDLILLDIELPELDGLTALETMQKDKNFMHIPVIVISGHTDKQYVKKASSLGVIDYIRKPYLASDLLARIEKVIGPLTLVYTDE